jgi:dTDP-4-amino-4,6-dideoxy-D-galactose acyltransferase
LAALCSEPCTLLEWDTQFWGRPIGRVLERRLDAAAVDAWAREHEIDCLYFLADTEFDAAHRAEDAGFRLMDVRVELSRSALGTTEGRVRFAHDDDREPLRSIARTSHRDTRFYADPGFPDDRCDEFYDVWISRSLDGWAQSVLVPEDGLGYVSCHADDKRGWGSIGLIAVDEAERGRGLGRELVLGAVAWARRRGLRNIGVVTQGRNVGAQRLFAACGFRVESVGLWFHKWYAR